MIDPGHLLDTFMPPPESEYHRIAHVEGPLADGTDGAMYNSAYARNLAHPAFGAIASGRVTCSDSPCFSTPTGRRRSSPV